MVFATFVVKCLLILWLRLCALGLDVTISYAEDQILVSCRT